MKSVRMFVFVSVLLFLYACPATGTINLKDGLTHNINYPIYQDVWVDYQAPVMYTTVNLLDGGSINDPYEMYGLEHSRINVRGGSIYAIWSTGFSQVNVSGGSIEELYGTNSSRLNISGGLIDYLTIFDSSHVNISGGSINQYTSYDSSQIDISGGSIDELNCGGSTQVNISGGSKRLLHCRVSSQVNISGGSINEGLCSYDYGQVSISGGLIGGDLILFDLSKIQIFGSDFAVDGQPFGYGELTSILGGDYWKEPRRYLTGTLASGERINNYFYIGDDAKIVLIPEPASAAILGLGSLFFALRHRRR